MLRTRKRKTTAPGLKHDSNKPQWHLLPWEELESVVKVLGFGAKKYGKNNWQRVQSGEQRYLDATLRHVKAILTTESLDDQTRLPHYAHAIASLMFAYWHSNQKVRRIKK